MSGLDPATVLVGRARELRELEQALSRALAGQGGVTLLVGEAGIGKTRLVDEIARTATARGAVPVFGRAWEAGGAPAYFPWTQALRGLAATLGKADFERLAGLGLSELDELFGARRADAAPPSTDPASARFRLFDSVSEVLRRAAEERPLLVALDDLHAADPSSLSLLHFVSRHLRTSRIFVVGTRRDEDSRLTEESRDLLARIAREGTTLALRRLDPASVAELVLAAIPGGASAVNRIVTATEGNPLFVLEYLRLAVESGGTLASAALPESVMGALRGRLSMLDASARDALSVASVLGREFDVQTVATLASATPGEVAGSLVPAVTARVVTDGGSGKRRFSHILFRDALYRGLTAERRAELHQAAATLSHSETERAHHLFSAWPRVPTAEAVRAACDAAAKSLSLSAFEDAVVLLAHAAEVTGTLGESKDRVELLLALAEAQFLSGQGARGKETARTAAAAARAIGDADLETRAALAYGSEFSPGIVDPVLVTMLEDALARLAAGPSALRARAQGRLAGAMQPCEDPEKPMTMARDAITMARALGDERVLLAVLHASGSALADFADPGERATFNGEATLLAEKHRETALALRAHARLVFDEIERSDLDASDRAVRKYEALSRELRRPHNVWPGPLMRAMRAVMEGRFAAAERWAGEAENIAKSAEDPRADLCFFLHRFGVARARWDDAGLRAVLGESTAFETLPGLFSEYVNLVRAGAAAFLGDAELARLCVERSHLRGITIEATWLAEAAMVAGDRAAAERLYADIQPYRHRFVSWGMAAMICEGPYATVLGELAAFLGRDAEAVPLFEESIELLRRLGLIPLLARALFGLGALLAGKDDAASVHRGRALLAEAGSIAASLSLDGLTRRLAKWNEPAAPAPSPSLPPPRDIRPTLEREGEYWALRAAGATHRFKDTKGLSWLAVLLSRPHEEIHVLDLVSPEGSGVIDGGDAGEALDRDAITAYRRRLEDLRTVAEEAESMNDVERARRARAEMESLAAELSGGTGLGGRERRTSSVVERARVNATRRIRDAIRRIEEQVPLVGRSLDAEIRTGVYCSYLPGSAPNRQK